MTDVETLSEHIIRELCRASTATHGALYLLDREHECYRRAGAIGPAVESRFPATLPLAHPIPRITSYNVCYTKLLRIDSGKVLGNNQETIARGALKSCSQRTAHKPRASGGTAESVPIQTFRLVSMAAPISGSGSLQSLTHHDTSGTTSIYARAICRMRDREQVFHPSWRAYALDRSGCYDDIRITILRRWRA